MATSIKGKVAFVFIVCVLVLDSFDLYIGLTKTPVQLCRASVAYWLRQTERCREPWVASQFKLAGQGLAAAVGGSY